MDLRNLWSVGGTARMMMAGNIELFRKIVHDENA